MKTSGILPVNAHAEVNILNLNYINRFFYSSCTRLSNDVHNNLKNFVVILIFIR